MSTTLISNMLPENNTVSSHPKKANFDMKVTDRADKNRKTQDTMCTMINNGRTSARVCKVSGSIKGKEVFVICVISSTFE